MNENNILNPVDFLGEEGPLSKVLKNYECRPAQIEASVAIRKALRGRNTLLCEAGTGTGKTFAALIPAIETAKLTGTPVIITTNTTSLQDQIFNKDIPLLKKSLGIPFKAVLIKGRNNYISKRRLLVESQNKELVDLDRSEVQLLKKIRNEYKTDSNGYLVDYTTTEGIVQAIKSDRDECLKNKCPYFKECYYHTKIAATRDADIIITNHNMVLADAVIKLGSGEGILPEYKHIIFDEAHTLEKVIQSALSFRLKKGTIPKLLSFFRNKRSSGSLDLIYASTETQLIRSKIKGIDTSIKKIKDYNEEFFFALRYSLDFKSKSELPLDQSHTQVISFKNLVKEITGLANQVKYIAQHRDNPKLNSNLESLAQLQFSLNQLVAIQTGKYPEFVSWAEKSSQGNITVVQAPISVKGAIKEILWDKIPHKALISATLSVNNTFDYLQRQLGLENSDTLITEQAFDYPNQGLLKLDSVPLPPWGNKTAFENYYEEIAHKIKHYIDKTSGNALILLTSRAAMEAISEKCYSHCQKKGYTYLKQSPGISRNRLLEDFKTGKNSVLFALESFWTGIDVPGKSLQTVIIPKLPFDPPTILSDAKRALYDIYNKNKPVHKKRNYFSEVSLPAMLIKTKQGAGRAIRTKTDIAQIVILDERAVFKYKTLLLNTLPKYKYENTSTN